MFATCVPVRVKRSDLLVSFKSPRHASILYECHADISHHSDKGEGNVDISVMLRLDEERSTSSMQSRTVVAMVVIHRRHDVA